MDRLISDILLRTPTHGHACAGPPAWTLDSVYKTCYERWMIKTDHERERERERESESGNFLWSAWLVDDDDDDDDDDGDLKWLFLVYFFLFS